MAASCRLPRADGERLHRLGGCAEVSEVGRYGLGRFADRAPPAIRPVFGGAGRVDLLIIDGYVHLNPHCRPWQDAAAANPAQIEPGWSCSMIE
jgi:hypothetical protein